jgi:ribosome-binding ATPase YchF (GTP1/OBG family)
MISYVLEEIKDRISNQKLHESLVAIVCAALESEMMTCDASERKEFLEMMIEKIDGESVPTLDDMIALAFQGVRFDVLFYYRRERIESMDYTSVINSTTSRWSDTYGLWDDGFIKAEVVELSSLCRMWQLVTKRKKSDYSNYKVRTI